MELTAAEARRGGRARAAGQLARREPPRARARLVFLGDLVSVYLGVLEGVDPTPIEAIDRLKAGLGKP